MVLSNQVRKILLKQSKINSFKNNYKSLIPNNDIPDTKQVYHDNMKKTVEKTINLNKKSSKKRKLEVHGNPNVLTNDLPTSLLSQAPTSHTTLVKIKKASKKYSKIKNLLSDQSHL